MSRKEVLEVISSVVGCTAEQANNYFIYATSHEKFKLLRRSGKVCSAQKTTTSRTQVTVEQQHRWHTTIDKCWEKQEEVNQPEDEFKKLHAYFQLNLDEECVMGSEGTVKVISSIFGKKVQKNMDDFKGSISVIRVGSAAGIEGPVIFLCAGKDKRSIPNNLKGDLSKKHGLPKGSRVVCTPTAYLTDESWLKAVPYICEGIREMEIVKDHPEWLLFLTLDGFASHLQSKAYHIFNKYNIQLVVEDGDTSQTNQAFDQMKAKEDKQNIRNLLDTHQSFSKQSLDQFSLIASCIVALKRSTRQALIDSFKRVNLHPDYRTGFAEWIKKIETQVVAGESFFKRRSSLYDIFSNFLPVFVLAEESFGLSPFLLPFWRLSRLPATFHCSVGLLFELLSIVLGVKFCFSLAKY